MDEVDEAIVRAARKLQEPVADGFERIVYAHPSQVKVAGKVFSFPVVASALVEPGEFIVRDVAVAS